MSMVTTYTETDVAVRKVTDYISLLDPSDTPLLDAFGGIDGAAGKFRFVSADSTKVEWLTDTLYPLKDALGASCDSATTSLTVANGVRFKAGDIIMVDSEGMYVSNVSSNTLTVSRAFFGSAASHANAAEVQIVSEARLEGAESATRAIADVAVDYNYTQILHEEVKVSGSEMAITEYGIDDMLEYQARKVVPHLYRLVERNLFYSTRAQGSASTPRAAGGLDYFITANTSNNGVSSTSLSETALRNAAKLAFEDGGTGPWIATIAPDRVGDVNALYNNSTYLKVEPAQSWVGMILNFYQSQFGRIDFVLDRWARKDRIYIVDPNHCGFLTLRPFVREPLAKSGDYEREQVLLEYTFCIRHANQAHAVIFGLA